MYFLKRQAWALAFVFAMAILTVQAPAQPSLSYEIRRLTHGPSHHFYGYIGHVGNSPYSHDGKWLIALRTTF